MYGVLFLALRNSTVATIFQMALVCKFRIVLCINLSMFTKCKVTLNFHSVVLGFNYSISNNRIQKKSSFKSNEHILKKVDGPYYVVSDI